MTVEQQIIVGGHDFTAYQLRMGYKYLTGTDMPVKQLFTTVANALIRDYGVLRVEAILTAIPNMKLPGSDAKAMIAAKAADPGAQPCQPT
jgi:hypothetical protein